MYNHWTPRGITGYIDADCTRSANDKWLTYQLIIDRELHKHGFEFMTEELCCEKTPLVLEHDYDSIPEDDARLDDIDFEPPLVPTTLHECLFSH